MASVQDTFLNDYEIMDDKELRNPILFVVDMVNGFVKEGALHDKSIMNIIPNIMDLMKISGMKNIFIRDAHHLNAREFLSYPPHCLIGTSESEVVDELKPFAQTTFTKNSTNTFHSEQFQEFIKDIDSYRDIIITGCCSDICILQFALSLQSFLNEHEKLQHRIIIPIDCIETYHIDQVHDAIQENEFSIRNMKANGIIVVKEIKRGC